MNTASMWVNGWGCIGGVFVATCTQMDDLYEGVYLFCGEATSGDLLFPGVAEFFTLLHIPMTIFHPYTPNPQTDLFTSSLSVHAGPAPPTPPHTLHPPPSNTCIQTYICSCCK